jgi:hypothetical protein
MVQDILLNILLIKWLGLALRHMKLGYGDAKRVSDA